MNDEIVMLSVERLEAHPYLAEDPMLDEASEDWLLLVNDIVENGIEHPLTVAEVYNECRDAQQWLLGDGRHRLAAAKEAGLLEVPCKMVSEDRLLSFMLCSESVRKNRTKSAQAWRAAAFCDEMIQDSCKARAANARGDDSYKSLEVTYSSLASIARQIGVSEGTLKNARSLRGKMLDYADHYDGKNLITVKEVVARMIYTEGVGLDQVSKYLKGVKGGINGAQETPDEETKWKLRGQYVSTSWDKTFRHLEYWDHFPNDQKKLVVDKVPELAKVLPAEVRSIFLAKLLELERTEKGA